MPVVSMAQEDGAAFRYGLDLALGLAAACGTLGRRLPALTIDDPATRSLDSAVH